MSSFKHKFSFPLALLFLVSCSEDKESLVASPGLPVQFSSGLSGMVESRAANGSWAANDEVGIYMVSHVASASAAADFSSYTDAQNVPYVTSGAGTFVSLKVKSGHDAICYPLDGSEVNFVAYYPYNSNTHTTNANIYKVDVTCQTPSEDIDLIYHKGTGTAYDKDVAVADVKLEFTHQLSKLRVCLIPASEDVAVDLTDALLNLTGFPSTADFNLSTGVLSNLNGAAKLLTATVNSSPSQTLYEAIVIPHSGDSWATSRRMSFAIDETEYHYDLPVSTVFEQGIAYNYIFKFTGTKVVLVKKTIIDWEGGTVAWGNNLLTVSNTIFNLTASGANKDTGVPLQVEFQTTASGAFTCTTSLKNDEITTAKPEWLTLTWTLVGEEDGWKKYRLGFTAERNMYSTTRTGYILAQVEGLNIVVRVDQNDPVTSVSDGLTNCYMVAPGGNVTIPITRAITIGGLSESAAAMVEPLWDDANVISTYTQPAGTGASRAFTVTTTSAQGNAVIALKSSDGTIYWSWHIWVCNYSNQTWSNNGFTLMDRNLGATEATFSRASWGLLYQWGRKDPFPTGESGTAGWNTLSAFKGMPDAGTTTEDKEPKYVTNTTRDATGLAAGILESIRYPTTYFSALIRDDGYEYRHNWLPMDDIRLWNTTDNKKTDYDPCPIGWRVIVIDDSAGVTNRLDQSPWYGYNPCDSWTYGSDTGTSLGVHATYACCKIRREADGDIYSVAWPYNLFIWLTGYSIVGGNMSIYTSGAIQVHGGRMQPGKGINVRCEQEHVDP